MSGFVQGMPLLALGLIFAGATAAVWWAGVRLSTTTEVLDRRMGMSHAIGGALLLAISNNLPDIAVVTSAAVRGTLDLAVGNLLGSVALQMVVLVVMDFIAGPEASITSRTKNLAPVVGVLTLMIALGLVLFSAQLEPLMWWRVEPVAILIVLTWLGGLAMIQRTSTDPSWQLEARDDAEQQNSKSSSKMSTGKAAGLFLFAALVILIAGVALEMSSSAIAADLGIRGIVFGGTVLALATSIPSLSTGYQATRLGQYQLVVTKEFSSNAFLVALLFLAGLVAGTAVISSIGTAGILFAGMGIVLGGVFAIGLIVRDDHVILRAGIDSLIVLVLYIAGLVALVLLV